jgi:SSS family solute:Na+ symporter
MRLASTAQSPDTLGRRFDYPPLCMQPIDWALIAVPLLIILSIGTYTQHYVKSVADFLSGGRLAGRYLLAVSRGEMFAGAAVFVAAFEIIGKAGFTLTWWQWINVPFGLFVAITGFVIYRYRETRALTLAQFFELRYSKAFRLVTGALGFFAGIVNFGVIPAIGARFFVYFLELPPTFSCLGVTGPTYIPVMALFLTITVLLTITGGLITVMMTDCIEGIISQVLYLVIIFALLRLFHWSQISEVFGHRAPGKSLLNPFDSGGVQDFNLWYVLMNLFVVVYGTMAWQNQSSFNAAALTAHEARMGGILGRWREFGKAAVVTLLGVCAVTYLLHPHFAAQAAVVHAELARIPDPQVREQMELPVSLAHLLPPGVKGAFCVVMLMGIFGGDSTHLHSWGGILIQDVIVPLRKRPFEPRQHVRMLRLAMAGVGVFAFIFGSLFRQTEYIMMWWAVTQAIYVGGAGAAIIGGLYWKKGTAAGAWAGLWTGSTLSVGGILVREIYGSRFPLNGLQISFYATLIAMLSYTLVSLVTCREDFNLDRMLHRGAYARVQDLAHAEVATVAGRRTWLEKLIGLDDEFTRGDRWIAGSCFAWGAGWLAVLLVGTIWNLVAPWPERVWSEFWHVSAIGLPVFLSVVTCVWFTWGGLHDMRELFRRLRAEKVNPLDDGTVVDHQNLDETAS